MITKNKYINELNRFALPLLLQLLTSQIIGITDVIIIGQISVEAFNSVSLISSTLHMLAGVLGAITISLNIRLGESLGLGDKNRFAPEFHTSIYLSLFLGIIFFLMTILFGKFTLAKAYNLSGNSLTQAVKYLKPMSLYVLLQLILFAHATYYKIINKTKIILYTSIATSILDVLLDYIFALGKFGFPALGVGFVGVSTIFTMLLNIVIYMYFVENEVKSYKNKLKAYIGNAFLHLKDTIPLFFQEILDGSVYTIIINMIIVRIGVIEYAAYTIINTIIELLFIFKYVYGSAVLSMISISKGAKNKKDINSYPKYGFLITVIFYSLCSLIVILDAERITNVFSENKSATTYANVYLVGFILVNFISLLSYIYKSALQALGESKYVLYISVFVNVLAAGIMFISTNIFDLELKGVMLSVLSTDIIFSVLLVRRYRKTKERLY